MSFPFSGSLLVDTYYTPLPWHFVSRFRLCAVCAQASRIPPPDLSTEEGRETRTQASRPARTLSQRRAQLWYHTSVPLLSIPVISSSV